MKIDIKGVAKRHGVGISMLAERLGVSRQTVHYYAEQGDKNPVSQLAKIAEAIGCSLQELMGIHEGNQEGSSYGVIRCPNCGSEIKLNPEI